MSNASLVDRLVDAYGDERVSETADGVVVDDLEGGSQLLVARTADSVAPRHLLAALESVTASVADHAASFGALVAPGVEYVFEPTTADGLDAELTFSALPDPDGTTETDPRPFRSVDELLFCFYRLSALDRQTGTMAIDDRTAAFADVARSLHRHLAGDLADDAETPVERATFGVFGGFDLRATDESILTDFVDSVSEADGVVRYGTRREIADFLVDLAGVEAGDVVLDPAAGIGSIARSAATSGGDVTGVEVDPDLVDVARFFLDLLDLDARIVEADFLAYDGPVLERADHVVLEPPATRGTAGEALGSLVTQEGEHVEETILRAAADSLSADARLTAFLPFGMLVRPDESASALRRYLREEFRIETLLEVVNPAYYPYPGVRTAVMELVPATDPGEYEVQVAVLEAATDASRFGTTGEKDLDVLLDETLANLRSGDVERVPISAFGEALSPSAVLRRREMAETVAATYAATDSLEAIADRVDRGQDIPWRDLEDEGIPYVRVATVTGHASEERYVPEADADVVATDSDLMVSIEGTVGELYLPEDPVVPGPEWAVVRFASPDEALVYATFFETTTGATLRTAIRESAIVPYPRYTPWLPLRRLRRLVLPTFTPDEWSALAAAIRDVGPDSDRAALDDCFANR